MQQIVLYAHGVTDSQKKTFFFHIVCTLLFITLLLSGCTTNPTDSYTMPTSSAPETDTETPPQEPLMILQQWLEKDCSFTISYQYMNLAINGISQKTTQTFAANGCWSFINQRKVWDHTADYESEENSNFYYCYENSELICYSLINGNSPQRAVVTKKERKAMDKSKEYMIGVPGLLPDYLQDLSVAQTDTAAIFTYTLPVEEVLADNTLLSVYIQNVFALSQHEYQPESTLLISCTFEAELETYQPKSVSFDFSQLKPYVLSSGAQSGEYAFDADFMTMEYTFDYNLPTTITVPENLIP